MHAFVFDTDSLRDTLHGISSGQANMQNRVLILSGFNFNSRDYLETVNTATHFPNLLDMEARQTPLGLLEFKDFTTDVAVIKKSALEAGHPEKGLVVLFDIHKHVEDDMLEAAKNRLIAANIKSRESKPVVVLTDMVDDWRMLYMDGETFHEERFESKARAEKVIEDTTHQAARLEYLEKLSPKPAG